MLAVQALACALADPGERGLRGIACVLTCLFQRRYGARVQGTFALQSLGASLMHIFHTEGIAGLWKGSVPSIIKVRAPTIPPTMWPVARIP